ncbi:MAG: glycogen synthase [Longimicrobiales bacterium]
MRVLFASAEALPYYKTGGLADVARALPDALAEMGADVRIIHPLYPITRNRLAEDMPGEAGTIPWPGGDLPVRYHVHEGGKSHADAVLVEQDAFFDTTQPYAGSATDPLELGRRFALFSRAIVAYARRWGADLVHVNDWPTGFVPVYALLDGLEAPTIFAIHNLAYQGNFPPELLAQVGVPYDLFRTENGLEFYRLASFMKAGITFSDRIVTVSPTYANEMRTPQFGAGFDGLLHYRRRNLYGILNGIDTSTWNPAGDPALKASYNARKLDGKEVMRAALLEECGLEDGGPLFVMVTRFAHQKGVDLVLDTLPELIHLGGRLAVLGDGDAGLASALAAAAAHAPDRIAVVPRFDEGLAHRLYSGGDFFLMPSRYEPCGLGQMIAQRYGTPPIVRATGGLADTVTDAKTGFCFTAPSAEELRHAVQRATTAWRARGWNALRRRCMRLDWSWSRSAMLYEQLYRLAVGRLAG